MATSPNFKVPPTEDTAFNKLATTGEAPNFSGGYYGDATFESGGGYEPVTDEERALIGNRVPGQSAVTNNYDLGPTYSTTNETAVADAPAFGPNAKYYNFSEMTPEQISATGTLGGTPYDVSPDARIDFKGPIINPLHNYASYTYGISLHMLTVEEYNQIVEKQTYTPNRVIIASAGRYNNTPGPTQFIRAPYFDEDFYFENLDLQTVIGLNDHSRATNAVNINFSIIEPYGVTLFNRILRLTKEINPSGENYLEQPYLLQIDFFGIDDTGEITGVIPNQTKKIPIRLLKFDIKVSNKGAEYSMQAAPYNHSAYDLSTVTTPAHFEIVAGSVAAFFQSNEAEIAAIQASATQQRELRQNTGLRRNTGADGGYIGVDGQITYVSSSLLSPETQSALAATATGDPVYRVKSYGSAINAWQNELKNKNKIDYADTYHFNFHPDIGESKFDLTGKYSAKNAPMTGVEQAKDARKSNISNIEVLALDYNTQIFSINAGTSLEMVLNYIIRNSNYIQDQLVIPEDAGSNPEAYQEKKKANATKPLRWFKIIPTVKLDPTKFDKVRKVWARDITYHIIPYEVYNTKISVAPQGTWNDPLKEYNYIYTGKNIDVLDFQIEFNALYYTATTAYRDNLAGIGGLPSDEVDKTTNVDSYSGIDDNANAIMPIREKPQTLDARQRATGGNDTAKSVAAVDVYESLYTTAGGDMLQAKLKIIGDPQYIKQDDIFYSPIATATDSTLLPTADPRLIANGSLHMDNREVYIRINYKSPSDIDESTGLMKFDNNFNQSVFSGMYRVLSVNNTFSGGQFIQTLETVRLPRQKSLIKDGQTSDKVNQRTVDQPGITYNPPIAGTDYPSNLVSNKSGTTGDDRASGNNPVQDVADPVTDADQISLASVANSAPEQTITDQNELQAVVPNFTPISVRGNRVPGEAAIT